MNETFLDLIRETPDDGTFATQCIRNSLAAAASKYELATPDEIASALSP